MRQSTYWGRYEQCAPLSLHSNWFSNLINIWQMQPLSVEQATDLGETIHDSATGTVSSIGTDAPSFIMGATQYVTGGLKTDNIAICAELARNPKWHSLNKWLPLPKAIVNIWGMLQYFNTYMFTLKTNKQHVSLLSKISHTCTPLRMSLLTNQPLPPKRKPCCKRISKDKTISQTHHPPHYPLLKCNSGIAKLHHLKTRWTKMFKDSKWVMHIVYQKLMYNHKDLVYLTLSNLQVFYFVYGWCFTYFLPCWEGLKGPPAMLVLDRSAMYSTQPNK